MSKAYSDSVIKVTLPKKKEIFTIRILVFFGLFSMGAFLWWFFREDRMGFPLLFWPLTIALFFKFLRTIHEWYHYLSPKTPIAPVLNKNYTVDMLTTSCPGEPTEMVINTLKAMKAVRYPHTTYLCDEGNDPLLKNTCEELDVVYVTREEKKDAKAGNINNALKQAKGEICIIMDPDHVPVPEFLDRVLPYFEDPSIGFVQSVQAYSNHKESLVALGACEQTYHFYGPMMMSMNNYGTAQAIGANCAFRRKALDTIGGHAPGLAEDMHTSMLLHSKGWKSIYIPEILTRGLVPSSLSAYYKQQLKWSRGTFDLFFGVLPKIFRKLTWRQKAHYGSIPLFFFYGLIDFVNILIPILSLVLAEFPWQVDLIEFTKMILPVIIMTLLIRQYSQRWLLETHERGFHIVGGLLRIGTWWIFSLGFIYTLFKIKVPYIPTPKDDRPENAWVLSIPNFIVCASSVAAIIYGLYIDWNPYTFFMAALACVNIFTIGFVVIIGQQRMLLNFYHFISKPTLIGNYIFPTRVMWWKIRHSFYYFMRNASFIIGCLTIFFFLSFLYTDKKEYNYLTSKSENVGNTGGFYAGIYQSHPDKKISIAFNNFPGSVNPDFDIISFVQPWGPESIDNFPSEQLKNISSQGTIPMITWEPSVNTFSQFRDYPRLNRDYKVMKGITRGLFDDYLHQYAVNISSVVEPVFIRFAHEPDNPAHPWSSRGGNTPEEYIQAWRYIIKFFEREGVSNVIWVWNPWKEDATKDYFPGADYVDWIGITCLNQGFVLSKSQPKTFEELYWSYRKEFNQLNIGHLPVMLTEVGSQGWGADSDKWIRDVLKNIEKFPEIQSVVIYANEYQDLTFHNANINLSVVDWKFFRSSENVKIFKSDFIRKKNKGNNNSSKRIENKSSLHTKNNLKGDPGNFELMVDGKPFYIKGVAYNSPYLLTEGHLPLTRSQLKKDFKNIKEMGANTIRRYQPGFYDRNILKVANEFDLKVIYGFWFEPDIDYFRDTIKLNEYLREVEKAVLKYKDYPAVLSWSLGNDTWNSTKNFYQKPYLNKVRKSYILFIERLARRIHELDPGRPVFAMVSHTNELAAAVSDFNFFAPSVDVIGVNSHDKDDLKNLHLVMSRFDYGRPYIISEFSPGGYWNKETLLNNDSLLVEKSDHDKANGYFWNWIKYVEFKKGYNLGGIAYTWRDKPEATATWFGITDQSGRLKPAYYALRRIWKDPNSPIPLPWVYISGTKKEIVSGSSYHFRAVTEYNLPGLKYEWYLQSEHDMEYIGKIREMGEEKKVLIKIPEKSSNMRLYLYVSDREGNVVTSSMPLAVKK